MSVDVNSGVDGSGIHWDPTSPPPVDELVDPVLFWEAMIPFVGFTTGSTPRAFPFDNIQ